MIRRSFCLPAMAVFALGVFFFAHAASAREVQALFVSDIHLDPFRDPAKVPQLVAAPVTGWKAILDAPASPDQAARFAALQQSCKVRGNDTDEALFASSLAAMRTNAGSPRFITLSGDLMAHGFSCKFSTLFPHSTPQQYESFVVKTLEYVLGSLRSAFPGVPLYATLGNNDSGCDDYRIDPNGSFLASSARAFTGKLPRRERKRAAAAFAAGGNFSVSLPRPFHHTRLLVVDDLFQSSKYKTCAGAKDDAGAEAQIAWLRAELEKARSHHEKIWVLGHIPPGIDPYATISKMRNVCGGKEPDLFLSSGKLPDTLTQYGDVIRLGIFAHTHMDEMRLLGLTQSNPVVIKMVPSISPVDGNNPAFTIATIDAKSATLRDYRVIAASNQTGIDTKWQEEYDYAQTYHKTSYTPGEVRTLLDAFSADAKAQSPESQSYLRNYFVGSGESSQLAPFWPQYTCALENFTADAYRACRCAATK